MRAFKTHLRVSAFVDSNRLVAAQNLGVHPIYFASKQAWCFAQHVKSSRCPQQPASVHPPVLSAFSRCLPDAVRRSKVFTGVRGAVGCLCAAREAKLRERAATESPSPVASSTLVAVVSAAAQRNQASKYLHVGGGRRVVCVLSKHTCGCPHS